MTCMIPQHRPLEIRPLRVIGLMSGTSMDGMDVAYLKTDGRSVSEKGAFKTYPYSPQTKESLRQLIAEGENSSLPFRVQVERAITSEHIQAVQAFMEEFNLKDVELIGFHGHTFVHKPDQGYTLQLGSGQQMADALWTPVIYDFRANDVAQGGQGAPFAPIYHAQLAEELEKPVAIVNIGGVSNITYIDTDTIIALDTGPGNALIDDWLMKHMGVPYDEGGRIASDGTAHMDYVFDMLQHPFFKKPLPKSLDRNEFHELLKTLDDFSEKDACATLAAFTAESIVGSFEYFPSTPKTLIVTGGGRHNKSIMGALEILLLERASIDTKLLSIDEVDHDGDALEAELFAYLAARSYFGLPISFPGTTGVPTPTTGGELVFPKTGS